MSMTITARRSIVEPTILLCGFLVLCAIYAMAMRLHMLQVTPLWLDETWSGMIATRPDWSSFWREAWLDCNPPLYYVFLTGWVSLFGDSNLAMRLPSFLFVLAAALLPLIWPPRTLDRAGIWTFAALILLWPSNLGLMVDARGYGLMLLLATGSCLAVAHMLERLTLNRAMLWVGLGTLMFLTHYYAAVLLVGQALVLLYRYGFQLARRWPAGLLAIPGLVWFAYHMSRLSDYARPDAAWYEHTSLLSSLLNMTYVLGAHNPIALAAVTATFLAAIVHHRRRRSTIRETPTRHDGALLLTVLSAVIGLTLAILISLAQPSLTNRYLVPLVPTAMLGLTLLIKRTARPDYAALGLGLAFLLPTLNLDLMRGELGQRAMYGYEESSDFVAAAKPDRLLFLWDSSSAKIMDRASLEALGGYFQQREGLNIPVQPVVVDDKADANRILRAAATSQRPAIIWLYNVHVRAAAKDHPPTFANDPSWRCDHAPPRSGIGSIGCVRQAMPSRQQQR
ncbi:glycosyltransferase family 39 protein [Sphingobium limneticum]|uniref:glycosyltransferase family 39 protein n=1 Tax=Sphingobium limneticum TaxID=1007511 RepID=UPI001375E908|nr:glycosyltransferase family 39 protein [Sphingobium limneticum]